VVVEVLVVCDVAGGLGTGVHGRGCEPAAVGEQLMFGVTGDGVRIDDGQLIVNGHFGFGT
jgi:hypothetical protein